MEHGVYNLLSSSQFLESRPNMPIPTSSAIPMFPAPKMPFCKLLR